jgi:hypothetical protein
MRMRDLNKTAKKKAKEMIAEVHDFTWNGEDNKSYKNAKKACLITISHVLEATKAEREGIVAYDPFWLNVKEEIEKQHD